MYTCHSGWAKCRCGTKTWAHSLGSLPRSNTHTHMHTPKHTRLPGPPFSPGRGCFSAHTYVSALRRYQACLMQWSCISISAGQTQINRNVLEKKCFVQISLQVSQKEREEPISFIRTKTFLMKTPRSRRGYWIDAFLFLIFFRLWATHITGVKPDKVLKMSKGKQIKFYVNHRIWA